MAEWVKSASVELLAVLTRYGGDGSAVGAGSSLVFFAVPSKWCEFCLAV